MTQNEKHTNRSQEKEILDLGPGHYTPQEFEHCQQMLFRVNKLLGCYRDMVNSLKRFSPMISVLDVGCGGGEILLHLGKKFPEMHFTGIDISADAIHLAERQLEKSGCKNVSFYLTEPKLNYAEDYFDVILATMVCHHLSDDELVSFLQQASRIAHHQVIINDLHRHPVPYWFFKLFSPILFRDRIITNDGLISIKRSFTRADWIMLLERAGITNYQIKWRFPFRWQVILFM